MAQPALVLCAHGTRDARGQSAITDLAAEVADLLPDVAVHLAYVDVQEPGLDAALDTALDAADVAVVVPLLVAPGFHVHHDIAGAVAGRPAVVTPTLATATHEADDPIVDILLDRIRAADPDAQCRPVLAPAGSSDARARSVCAAVAARLAAATGREVALGYAASTPGTGDVAAAVRATGGTPLIVSLLLAPGHFQDRLEQLGAPVTPPLLPEPRIAELLARRYRLAAR